MIKSLKLLKRDLTDVYGRFRYFSFMLRNFPGKLGEHLRSEFYKRYFASCGTNITIFPGVRFRGIHKLRIGNNVCIGVDNFIQASGGVIIEDNVMLGPGVKIWSVNHKFDDLSRPISEQGFDEGLVVIEDDVWIAANVFILPGVKIPKGCVVSAGSVVGIKKYPPYSILSGNPCRVIGNRSQ